MDSYWLPDVFTRQSKTYASAAGNILEQSQPATLAAALAAVLHACKSSQPRQPAEVIAAAVSLLAASFRNFIRAQPRGS